MINFAFIKFINLILSLIKKLAKQTIVKAATKSSIFIDFNDHISFFNVYFILFCLKLARAFDSPEPPRYPSCADLLQLCVQSRKTSVWF